mgnify:CR=1 FL=1
MLKNFSSWLNTPLLSNKYFRIFLVFVVAFAIFSIAGLWFWKSTFKEPSRFGKAPVSVGSTMGIFEKLYAEESLGKRIEDSDEGCPQKFYQVRMKEERDNGWLVEIGGQEMSLEDEELEHLCKKIRVLSSSDQSRGGWTNSQNLKKGDLLQVFIACCDGSYSSFCDLTDE